MKKRIEMRTTILLAGVVLALGNVADASLVLSYGSSVPTGNVMASYAPGGSLNGLGWRNLATGSRELGQSFQATADTLLDSFSLKAGGGVLYNASEAAFVLTVYESASKTAIGSAISAQSGIYFHRDETLVSGDWITFDIDNVNMTSGNYYTCMLAWDDPGMAEKAQTFAVSVNNGYAAPLWTAVDGAAYSEYTNVDIPFVAQTIPEPASLGLIGISCGLIIAGRRWLSI